MSDDSCGWRRPGFIPGLIVIVCLGVLTAYAWFRLPSDAGVTVQWDPNGNPSNVEDKSYGLLITPIILIVLAPLLDVVPFVPLGKNSAMYRGENNLLVWYLLLAVGSVVQIAIVVNALRNG